MFSKTAHNGTWPSRFTGYADVNGIKPYQELYGEGEPVVLIHGGLTTIGEMHDLRHFRRSLLRHLRSIGKRRGRQWPDTKLPTKEHIPTPALLVSVAMI